MKKKENDCYRLEEYHYHRYPLWWGQTARDTFEILLKTIEWKYAKQIKEGDNKHSLYYANIPIAFDIEDSSFYNDEGDKVSIMYVWQLDINGYVFMGRDWSEFIEMCHIFNTVGDNTHRFIIYVHFLDHEFQFLRKRFTWTQIFSRKNRSPIYAVTGSIEFRDSYILTGKSLAKSAEDIRTFKGLRKKVGDLDYDLMRGTKTHLTRKEIGYCMADVQTLSVIIHEKIEDEGSIARIPLTNTGYVRRYCRKTCIPADKAHKEEGTEYYQMIHDLTLRPDEYIMLKAAFQGGFTHANSLFVGDYLTGRIDSIDFTSSYPAVLLSNPFPMSSGRIVAINTQDDLERYCNRYLCVFTVRFTNIRQKKTVWENILSESKCRIKGDKLINNGRIVSADEVTTVITNIDLDCIRRFYDFDNLYIGRFYVYEKGYLPKAIIKTVLDLYRAKTTLKGVPGAEVEYMLKKGMLNSVYGMMVTDIVKELCICDESGEWQDSQKPDLKEAIDKYNNNRQRFLFYPWGIFVTAYARRNLYSGILEFSDDYVYSDTDSIKCRNIEKHINYINRYNDYIISSINHVLDYYNICHDEARPENIKGSKKQIGVWDWETEKDPYTEFKTLGAKRYMYRQSDGIHITIAGVSKNLGKDFIAAQKNPFEFFDDGMIIDKEHSGKLTHTYLDYEQKGIMKDYRGAYMKYEEKSSVHLEASSYEMSIMKEFKDYCEGVKHEYIS